MLCEITETSGINSIDTIKGLGPLEESASQRVAGTD